jgi:hypothetical protein
VLVATGALPPPDEQMARLERVLEQLLSTQTDPEQRSTIAPRGYGIELLDNQTPP